MKPCTDCHLVCSYLQFPIYSGGSFCRDIEIKKGLLRSVSLGFYCLLYYYVAKIQLHIRLIKREREIEREREREREGGRERDVVR